MSVQDFGWMAATIESAWHRIIGVTGSGCGIAGCGHVVRGPVHRRLSAPRDIRDGRELCATCFRVAFPATTTEIAEHRAPAHQWTWPPA